MSPDDDAALQQRVDELNEQLRENANPHGFARGLMWGVTLGFFVWLLIMGIALALVA